MNIKLISIGIACLIFIAGFMGFINLSTMNVQGTDVSGTVYDGAGGPWTLAGSPYIVIGDVTIPPTQTLTIDPGVEVKFDGSYRLTVSGDLYCIGSESARITITSNSISPSPGNWDGIYVYGGGNVNINSTDISYGDYGIYCLGMPPNNIITNSSIFLNNNNGINLGFSSYNIITNNDFISNNGSGVHISTSVPGNNTVSENRFINNNEGIYIGGSYNNTITNNNITMNNANGIDISSSTGNVVVGNNITSNNGDGIYLDKSWENRLIGNNISSNNDDGISLWSASFNEIIGNNLHSNTYDEIFLDSSSNNTIRANIISNGSKAILLYLSNDNIVESNELHWHSSTGISIQYSSYNNITGNNLSNNNWGVSVSYYSYNNVASNRMWDNVVGIYLKDTSYNNLTGNNLWGNFDGIYFHTDADNNRIEGNEIYLNTWHGISIFMASGNTFVYNNVTSNANGIRLQNSLNNMVYHNNIVSNGAQAFDTSDSGNQWDNGYPLGGNYWSDYGGVDHFKGPYQDMPGGDGIGDTPYVIDADSQDNYPLMGPYSYKPLENYTILKKGWNLISIPHIQDNQNLKKVLEMINGWYDAVQWYDNKDKVDPWKHKKVGKPFGNDLSKINETMGFWIHIINPGDTIFIYNGTEPTSNQTISIHPGWNMVGYPSNISYNRTIGLNNLTFDTHVDAIWTHNASTQKWKELGPSDYFELCRGYWIHAKAECGWEVPL